MRDFLKGARNILDEAGFESTEEKMLSACSSIVTKSDYAFFAKPPLSNHEIHSIANGIYHFIFHPQDPLGSNFDIQFESIRAGSNRTIELFEFASETSNEFLLECYARFTAPDLHAACIPDLLIECLLSMMFRYRLCEADQEYFPLQYVMSFSTVAASVTNGAISRDKFCFDLVSLLSIYNLREWTDT